MRREFQNIDIFLREPLKRIVVVLENKVGTTLHGDQLKRYHEIATQQFPKHRFMGIYLTPEGEDSNDANFIPFSYEGVRALVTEVLNREDLMFSPNFRSVLEQYGELLDRRFMVDKELQELCARIYKRHKQAIDILIRNLSDEQSAILSLMKKMVSDANFKLDECGNNAVRFVPESFAIPAFKSETAWLESGQMVYLEFRRKREDFVFQAKMDGGSSEQRAKVHAFARSHQPPFRVDKAIYEKYQVLYSQTAVEGVSLSEGDDQGLSAILNEKWVEFEAIIGAMSKAVQEHSW